MAKPIKTILKLQIEAGKANPAPPIGPALGQHGINIAKFCADFNEATKTMAGEVKRAVLTVYEDRTFDFILKTAPVSSMLKKAAGIEKGSAQALKKTAGSLKKSEIKRIAEKKLEDLNTADIQAATKIIEGTAKSMGIELESEA